MSKRVLIVGDSPLIKTGFGRVNAIAAKRFQREGWEVASVAGLTTEPPKDDEGIKIYVPSTPQDTLGILDIHKAVDDFKPDVAYTTADLGSVTALAYGLPEMPMFIYTPIEGEPIANRDWRAVLHSIPSATCSQYGVDVVKATTGREIPYYYHGVDHDTFKPSDNREQVRESMGWQDKFVVMCVATNVRRKQITRLIEAFSIAVHEMKAKDIVLYLHTVPFQNYWLEGWNLPEVARAFSVNDQVQFHPLMFKRNAFIPETTGNPQNPGLVEIYGAADLFVLPSQVEGFGLPIAEAMACGLPALVTKYAAGWEVARDAGRGIPVRDWEVHKSGTMYANVDTRLLAKEIVRLQRNPKERARMSQRGLQRAQDFRWDDFLDALIPSVENAIVTYKGSRVEAKGKDQRNLAARASIVGTGKDATSHSAAQGFDIIERQGEDSPSAVSQDEDQSKEEAAAPA